MDRFDESIADYKKVLDLDPGYYDAHFSLGAVYEWLHRYDDAIAEYTKYKEMAQPKDSSRAAFMDERIAYVIQKRDRPSDENVAFESKDSLKAYLEKYYSK